MPLMAAHEQNDARDSVRLLAMRSLEGLRSREVTPSVSNAINNMYRLLAGYRSHGFYGHGEQVQADDPMVNSLQASADRNIGDLRVALDETFTEVFDNLDAGTAIDEMKVVFRMVAYPKADEIIDPVGASRAEKFLVGILDHLQD